MSFELWLAFTTASVALLVIPGPTVLLVTSYALSHGRRSAVPIVAGVALGDFTAMTASLLGLGVLLATSATVFTLLKWIGAAYLVWLGIKLWRAPAGQAEALAEPAAGPARMLLHAYAVTALNPKGIVFFVAFLPQFLDASRPAVTQMAVMEATFVSLAILNTSLYAALASTARRAIRRPTVQRTVNRLGGSLLIGAGLMTAAWRRAAT